MGYRNILDTLGQIRKLSEVQALDNEMHFEDRPGGVFTGINAAPRMSYAVRRRVTRGMEAAGELGIDLYGIGNLAPGKAVNGNLAMAPTPEIANDSQTGGETPEAEYANPAEGEMPEVTENVPAEGEMPAIMEYASTEGEMPAAMENDPIEEETPAIMEYASTEDETPAIMENIPVGGETPAVMEYDSTGGETPAVMEYDSTGGETPAIMEYISTGGETPAVMEYNSTGGETPAVMEYDSTEGETPAIMEYVAAGDEIPKADPFNRAVETPNEPVGPPGEPLEIPVDPPGPQPEAPVELPGVSPQAPPVELPGSASGAAPKSVGGGADVTLDEEIARLLEEDRKFSGNLPDFSDIDFIDDVSVFNSESRALRDETLGNKMSVEPKPKEKIKQKSPPSKTNKWVAVSAALASCLMLAVCGGVYFSNRKPSADLFAFNLKAIPVKIPDHAINNASYIFFDKRGIEAYDDIGLFLKKMAYGPLSTVFYFSDGDLSNYMFELSDQSGKVYLQDMTLAKMADAVVFRPFDKGVAGFKLSIEDARNGVVRSANFALEGRGMMPARYINSPVDISPGKDGSILIHSAVFTNTGANIQLAAEGGIVATPNTRVSMLDGRYSVLSKKTAEGLYSGIIDEYGIRYADAAYKTFPDAGVTLVRADFEPVRSLEGQVSLSVSGLGRQYSPNIVFEAGDLYNFMETGGKSLRFDRLKLVLEGMERQDEAIALVMHGEDPFTGKRVEVKASVDLVERDWAGNEKTLEGECWSGPEGTDVLFKFGEEPDSFMEPARMQIKLNRVEMILNKVSVDINLSELDTEPFETLMLARSGLEGAYAGNAQADLFFLGGDGKAIGTVLVPPGIHGGLPVVHLIKAGRDKDQWVIQSDSQMAAGGVS